MMGKVEEAIDELRDDEHQFEMGGKLCVNCRGYKPPPTKKCHTCRTDEFIPLYCDSKSRVCEFLGALTSANVWPLSRQMEGSAVAFLGKVESVTSRFYHTCNGGNRCPLSPTASTLGDKLGKVKIRSKGLDLQAFQRSN